MKEKLINTLETLSGAYPFEQRSDGLWMDAPNLDIVAAAEHLQAQGARLSTITALALEGGETQVIYHYTLDGMPINLSVWTLGDKLPSITPVTPAADWAEREIADLYAVCFNGHPNPTRLVRPTQLEPGYFREVGGAAGKAVREPHH